MKNISNQFENIYIPVKGLVIYNCPSRDTYVELYDMDKQGCPINARPLTVKESCQLATLLDSSDYMQRGFLRPHGLLPKNLLYLNPSRSGFVIWYTPPREMNIYFTPNLGLKNGKAKVPPLIWKADKENLEIYSLNDLNELTPDTPLYHAPFFNVYQDGRVCTGTVDINIDADCMLEEFMQTWEDAFFNSNFSHQLDANVVKGNLTSIWKKLLETPEAFPLDVLLPNTQHLKNLFV